MLLRCPKCHEPLHKETQNFRCIHAHSYDVAKSGYINLYLSNKKMTGDNKEMVDARTTFLSHNYYEPLQKRLCELVGEYNPSVLVDAGCGQGYYTNACKSHLESCDMYGFDLSKFALKDAAKVRSGVHYAVASIADMPLEDASSDMVLSVFAPVMAEECHRVLKDGGLLLKVGPGPRHLYDLKQVLYTQVYENESEATQYPGFTLLHEELLDYEKEILGQIDIKALFQMTPYYYRSPKQSSQDLLAMDRLKTQIQFHIEVYRKG